MGNARFLARTALLIALTAVATLTIRIPNPATQGYINLGDGVILTAGLAFGGRIGGLAGGLGSALADGLGGYFIWAPWTLVIKGVEGGLAGILGARSQQSGVRMRWVHDLGALAIACVWMVAGYFGAGALLFGKAAALTEIPGNLFQAAAGCAVALPMTPLVRRIIPLEEP